MNFWILCIGFLGGTLEKKQTKKKQNGQSLSISTEKAHKCYQGVQLSKTNLGMIITLSEIIENMQQTDILWIVAGFRQ